MAGDTFNLGSKQACSSEDQPPHHHEGKARPSVRPEKLALARRLLQQPDYPNAQVVAGVAARLAKLLHRGGKRISF